MIALYDYVYTPNGRGVCQGYLKQADQPILVLVSHRINQDNPVERLTAPGEIVWPYDKGPFVLYAYREGDVRPWRDEQNTRQAKKRTS